MSNPVDGSDAEPNRSESEKEKKSSLHSQNFEALSLLIQKDIGDRYSLIKPVGHGAYGVVWSAHDVATEHRHVRGTIAIKRITSAFEKTTDTKRLLREILLLKHLEHSHVLGIRNLIAAPLDDGHFTTLYIITELMDTDLHKIIQSPQQLSDQHIQYFVYQILRGLNYLHSAGILHRDLKPSNILLNENCELKICDFGLSRSMVSFNENAEKNFLTEYVVTRWYRSPELLLQEKNYTTAIDVWSVGCILAEMMGRKPIFPGTNYIDELLCITNILGTPPPGDYHDIGSELARQFISNLEPKEPVAFSKLYPKANPVGLSFLASMLQFNCRKRASVNDLLCDPYLKDMFEEGDNIVAESQFVFQYEGQAPDKFEMKEIIYAVAVEYDPNCADSLEELKQKHRELATRTT